MYLFKNHKGLAIEQPLAPTQMADDHLSKIRQQRAKSKILIRLQQKQLFAQIYFRLTRFDKFLFKRYFNKNAFKITVWLLGKYFRKRVLLTEIKTSFKIKGPDEGYFFDKLYVYDEMYEVYLSHFGDLSGYAVKEILRRGGNNMLANGIENVDFNK